MPNEILVFSDLPYGLILERTPVKTEQPRLPEVVPGPARGRERLPSLWQRIGLIARDPRTLLVLSLVAGVSLGFIAQDFYSHLDLLNMVGEANNSAGVVPASLVERTVVYNTEITRMLGEAVYPPALRYIHIGVATILTAIGTGVPIATSFLRAK